jgi:hypothetical protein
MNNLSLLLCQTHNSTMVSTSNTDISWSLIISSIIIVIGWFIVHYFSQKRDFNNKKREIVIEYLIKTYRVLANDVLQRNLLSSPESKKALEDILSDLQLIGSEEQVQMARELADAAASGSDYDLSPIINNLRQSLRQELKLKHIEGNIIWLRLNR